MVLGLYVKPENIWISLLLYHCTMLLHIPTWIIVWRCEVTHTNLTQILYWDCRKESCVSLQGLQNSCTLQHYLVNYIFRNWSKFTTMPCRCSCIAIIITCHWIYFEIFFKPNTEVHSYNTRQHSHYHVPVCRLAHTAKTIRYVLS